MPQFGSVTVGKVLGGYLGENIAIRKIIILTQDTEVRKFLNFFSVTPYIKINKRYSANLSYLLML